MSQPKSSPITVSIVDDDPMICQAMRLILTDYSNDEITVISTATDGRTAVEQARNEEPDVVLMDIAMPDMNGFEATQHLRALPNAPHVLILTSLASDNTVTRAVEDGVEGFISKTDAPEDIIRRIIGVCHGNPQFNPASQRQLIGDLNHDRLQSRRDEARMMLNALPEREREAVILAAEGLSNTEIAQHMFISERTAKAHLSSASDKLCMNRVQMARLVERADMNTNINANI